jgi:hypothetical protein
MGGFCVRPRSFFQAPVYLHALTLHTHTNELFALTAKAMTALKKVALIRGSMDGLGRPFVVFSMVLL